MSNMIVDVLRCVLYYFDEAAPWHPLGSQSTVSESVPDNQETLLLARTVAQLGHEYRALAQPWLDRAGGASGYVRSGALVLLRLCCVAAVIASSRIWNGAQRVCSDMTESQWHWRYHRQQHQVWSPPLPSRCQCRVALGS